MLFCQQIVFVITHGLLGKNFFEKNLLGWKYWYYLETRVNSYMRDFLLWPLHFKLHALICFSRILPKILLGWACRVDERRLDQFPDESLIISAGFHQIHKQVSLILPSCSMTVMIIQRMIHMTLRITKWTTSTHPITSELLGSAKSCTFGGLCGVWHGTAIQRLKCVVNHGTGFRRYSRH